MKSIGYERRSVGGPETFLALVSQPTGRRASAPARGFGSRPFAPIPRAVHPTIPANPLATAVQA
jgi:hypothetical protein